MGIVRSARLARNSHTVAGVTEVDLLTGKEKPAGRMDDTDKGFDAACRQRRPALRVASGWTARGVEALNRRPGYAFRPSPAGSARRDAMTLHEGMRNAG